MNFGYIITVSGKNFNPSSFFNGSTIQPDSIFEVDDFTVVQFCDLSNTPYKLDMLWEAIDYIIANRDEFEELFRLPDIENKKISFYDTTYNHGGGFNFSKDTNKLLYELGFEIEISVISDST